MGRERLLDDDVHARRDAVMLQKPVYVFQRPLGIWPGCGDGLALAGGQPQQWRRRRRANAAEPAPERPSKIEHAEVQARVCFNVNGLAAGARHRDPGVAAEGADRMKALTSDIASNSRGPAVLSTITCSRWSSLSRKSRGSICTRVA